MENTTQTPMTVDESLELACRLIERHDDLLGSLESRTATIVSADALLLAGTTFLADKVLSQVDHYLLSEQIMIGVNIFLVLVALALSIAYAASGIANLWKTTRQQVGDNSTGPSLFFRASNTAKALKDDPKLLEEKFRSSSKEQVLKYALSELWLVTNLSILRQRRYQNAVRLLLFSVVPFLVAFAITAIK